MELSIASKSRINVLQAGRALAAFGVLVNHCSLSVNARVGEFPLEMANFLKMSNFRVDFFFVLSGFIIYLITHGKGLSGPSAAYAFLRKRAIRIYPLYWIITIMLLLRFFNDISFDWSEANRHWFPTLTLLPHTQKTLILAAWTLQYELLFYIMFGIGILLNRLHLVVIGWTAMLLFFAISGITLPYVHDIFTSDYNLEFVMGLAAAYLFFKHPIPLRICAILAIVCLAGYHLTDHRLFIGLFFAPFILFFSQLERAKRISVPRWVIFLGDSSYSLYLSHNIVINLLTRTAALHTDNPYIGLLATCAGCYLFAIIIYLGVEKPLIRWTTAKN